MQVAVIAEKLIGKEIDHAGVILITCLIFHMVKLRAGATARKFCGQQFTGDMLTTIATAATVAQLADETPSALVLHPVDAQSLRLMREGGSTGPLMFDSGRSSLEAILAGARIVASRVVPQGTAVLGDFSEAVIVSRMDNTLDVDGSGELFRRSLVQLRFEGRYGFAVSRPAAFTKISLTA